MSFFGCKGKGKDLGKGKDFGKGKGKTKTKTQGHTLERTRLSAEKFSGTVTAWKGKYGWIHPAEEIAHEKAKLHNGGLFCSVNDIEGGADSLEVGVPVEFHICEDSDGLGAEEVVVLGPATAEGAAAAAEATAAAKAEAVKKYGLVSKGKGGFAKGKGKDSGKDSWGSSKGSAGKSSWGSDSWGGGSKGGWSSPSKGWSSGSTFTASAAFSTKGKGKPDGGKFGSKGKDSKGKGKDSKGKGKGHLLPRTRISAEKFMGTVSAWKGKYGWIQPAEEIAHEKAGKHNGGLFCSKDDLEGSYELTVGATVEFHIWEDASGLGAEEVVQH